jgi:hypothetical protein
VEAAFALLARTPNFDPVCVVEMNVWDMPPEILTTATERRVVADIGTLRELFLEMTPLKSYTVGRKTLRLRTGVVPLNLHTLGDRPSKARSRPT